MHLSIHLSSFCPSTYFFLHEHHFYIISSIRSALTPLLQPSIHSMIQAFLHLLIHPFIPHLCIPPPPIHPSIHSTFTFPTSLHSHLALFMICLLCTHPLLNSVETRINKPKCLSFNRPLRKVHLISQQRSCGLQERVPINH